MLEAVLFDFDLTLVDSRAAVADCANFALRRLELPEVEAAQAHATIGLTLPQAFTALTGVDDAGVAARFVQHWVERADVVTLELVTIYAAVPALLAELRARGIRTGIVSSRFRYRIEAILHKAELSAAIDRVVGLEDVAEHKPHPAGIHAVLSSLGVESARALFVGDHLVDAQAAHAAGVRFVGVLSGGTSRAAFAEIGAHETVESVAELLAYLE
jgi:phosphoglycolate phosphatase